MDEFSEYSDKYKETVNDSISFSGLDIDFFTKVKVDYLTKTLGNSPVNEPKILDLGCGVGTTDRYLTSNFKNLSGCDVSGDSIEKAKVANPGVTYSHYDGVKLPYEDESFDFVFTINVMHHVPPEQWPSFLLEARRVLKKGGHFIVFEHNPYNPLTLKAVRDCPFDENAVLLKKPYMKKIIRNAGLSPVDESYILFFPFRSEIFRKVEKLFKHFPLGAQYYVLAQKAQA